MRYAMTLLVVLLSLPGIASAQAPAASSGITLIYFVRHAEVDPTQPTFPLSAAGRLKAEAFARAVGSVPFTHVFSSHTTRAREMVEPVAQARRLPVRQLPVPGTRLDTLEVTDRTSSRVAITPLVDALRALPPGSSALVGVNSDNVYAILHGLGVPLATAERPCPEAASCVPCLSNDCASPRFDQLWILVVDRAPAPPRLIELRYGTTGEP